MQVTLVMFKADGTRRDFPLSKERIVVGRKNTCDLRIPLSSVSRQHCEIRVGNGAVTLRDLGSSNGTFHNSIRVQEATLAAGDEVVIGPVVFTVVVDGRPEDVQPLRSSGVAAGAAADEDADQSPALAAVHADEDDDDFPAIRAQASAPAAVSADDDDEDRIDLGPISSLADDEDDERIDLGDVEVDEDDDAREPAAAMTLGPDDDDDDDDFPNIKAEESSPTVDIDEDDDPIAALERLAEAERSSGTSSGIDFDFDLDDEDEDDVKNNKKK